MWERKEDESPCRACIVALEESNVDVVKVFLAVRHHIVLHQVEKDKQYIDLDIKAVKIAMDLYEVKDQVKCYERVRSLFVNIDKEPTNG
jgi:hypothetical protein